MPNRVQSTRSPDNITHILAGIGICTIAYLAHTILRTRKHAIMTSTSIYNSPTSPQITDPDNIIRAPSPIIQLMYLEITNISQGLIIGFLVLTVKNQSLNGDLTVNSISTLVFAVTSFTISIIFWTRYYFDTEIIQRSYTTLSILWFFIFIIAQVVSVSLISNASAWLLSTGVFLSFASGFYIINLMEIFRKQAQGVLPNRKDYISWQIKRMLDLFVISILTFIGGYLVLIYPGLEIAAALYALCIAIWQLVINRGYRKFKFISTGI